MRIELTRIIRTSLMAVLLTAVLGACSTVRLAYNNAQELAWWWLTDYVSLTEPQRPVLRQALGQVHAWHRRSQLPAYAELLARWQGPLMGELSTPQVCSMVDELMVRLDQLPAFVDALEPPALQALATLSPAQLQDMERRMAKANREYRAKYLEASPQQRAAERFKQALSRSESLYGRLTPEQRQVLEAALARAPWDAQASYERRLKRQQEWLQGLRALHNAPPEQVRVGLKTLVARSLNAPDAAERAASLAARRNICQVMAELHQSTTPAQRAKAVDTLKGYAGELRVLAQAV